MFSFFPSVAPVGIEVTPDINHYLGFVLKLFFAFGIAFEVPIATILLIKAGVTTREKLAKKRQYVVLGAFVLGMLLTPPDIFSQTMLALPMWLLFELGLIMSKYVGSPPEEDDEGPDDNDDGPAGSAAKGGPAPDKPSPEDDSDEEEIISPAVMPQQARAAQQAEDEKSETEEDFDKLVEELDNLEDITSWIQPEEGSDADDTVVARPMKSVKKKKSGKKSVKKKSVKSKKASKKSVKTKKTRKSVKTKTVKKAKKEKKATKS
jgi:hypothetical protein